MLRLAGLSAGAGVVTAGATGLAFQAPAGQAEGGSQQKGVEPGTGSDPSPDA